MDEGDEVATGSAPRLGVDESDPGGGEARELSFEVVGAQGDVVQRLTPTREEATDAATGRLLPSQDGQARLGRMAVHRAMRGAGCGRQVLLALMDAARQRGDRSVLLHAQAGAEPFYSAAGYVRAGEPFDEVGIPHITMRCML